MSAAVGANGLRVLFTDGMIKRFNRTLLSMLSTVLGEEGEENWEVALPAVMLATVVALIRQHTNLHSC